MCTLYTYTNTYMPRFSPSGFSGSSKCLVPTPGLTSEYPTCSVCACVRIQASLHTHTFTYTPNLVKKWRNYRQKLLSCHVKNNVPHQQQVPCIERTPPPSSLNENKQTAYIRAHERKTKTAHTRAQTVKWASEDSGGEGSEELEWCV